MGPKNLFSFLYNAGDIKIESCRAKKGNENKKEQNSDTLR
tara:strand:+ start:232 stop:351 length:120 start_codon:yes stop_codon:yes gene_type:complete